MLPALLLAVWSARAAAAPGGVRLEAAGPAQVRFTVSVPEAVIEPPGPEAGPARMRLAGYANGAPPGAPPVLARVVHVAVPPVGEVAVRSSADPGEVRDGVVLAPPGDGAGVRARAAAPAGRAKAERARLLGVSWMRNQRVASIAILPAEEEPAAQRVTLYHQIQVEVDVAPASDLGPPFEADDPFENVYREVLINYEQGRGWRRPAAPRGRAAAPATRVQLATLVTPTVPDTSVYVGRGWIKIAISQTGFYQVNFGQLRNLPLFTSPAPLDSVRLDSLRLFTWPGYPVLPENSYCDSCDFREVAIQFMTGGSPGWFGPSNRDAFYFFALGPSDWANLYDPARPDSIFLDHPYETKNSYYLTLATTELPVARGAPARISTLPSPVAEGGSEIRPTSFTARVHYEQDVEYFPDLSPDYYGTHEDAFWEKWFWRSMQVGNVFSPVLDALGVDSLSSEKGLVRVRQWGLETCIPSVGHPCPSCVYPDHLLQVTVGAAVLPWEGWTGLRPFAYEDSIPAISLHSHNTVSVQIPSVPSCPQRIDRSLLAWIELRYPHLFVPVDNELAFDSWPTGGNYIYDIGPFTSATPPRVFDVTDAYAPVEVVGFDWTDPSGPAHQLRFETLESGIHHYRIVRDSSIASVADASIAGAPLTSFENLRSHARGADYVLLYADGFQAAADSLAAWRHFHLPLDGGSAPFEVQTIPISALYDQFNGGRTDPSVIRNFLRGAFFNWSPRPAFVTLLGDASFDFKNIKGLAPAGQPGTLMPSYENGYAIQKQFATDDWLLNVDNPTLIIPDFYGGRIPAPDAGSALDYVLKKLLPYEREAPFGSWRDKVLLIADDNIQPQPDGSLIDPLGWQHLFQTADLDSTHTPQPVDRAYVYLHTYPTGAGLTKPGAKADIKQIVNDGVVMFNYIGHGSPFKLADETVLSDVDAGTFTNATRPALFVAASCDVGKFNDPTVQSLGERMVLAPTGGAVAVISATEVAYSSLNVDLNDALYDQLFNRATANGQYHESIAQALLIAKQLTSYGSLFNITNNSKYQVMGDASTRLNLPRLWVDLSLHDCDTCSAILAEVQRGKTVTFRGRVMDRPGGNPVSLDGTADVLIEDSSPRDQPPGDPSVTYWFKAGPMFRGDVRIVGGELQGKFVAPIEARGGARGRVRAYIQGRAAGEGFDTDGVGSIRAQVSPGPPVTGDDEGPRITLSFASGSTTVRPDAVLRVDIADPSGILITGHTIQNGIVLTLDGNTTARVDITSTFRYATGSFTAGTATWQLPNLSVGQHTIRVSAADNLAAGINAAAHRSSAAITIQVAQTPPLTILHAYLFPNPTISGRGGQFVVDALGDRVNALLRIYTVSGRLIRTLKSFDRQGQIQIPWDGLDDEGMGIANGTYLFRVQLNGREATGESSALQKAVAEGRIVILNH